MVVGMTLALAILLAPSVTYHDYTAPTIIKLKPGYLIDPDDHTLFAVPIEGPKVAALIRWGDEAGDHVELKQIRGRRRAVPKPSARDLGDW